MHSGTKWAFKGVAGILAIPALSMAAFKYFDTASVPTTLSATGLYTNIVTKAMDTAAKPFEVNAALWSDDAAKKRWIILRPGKRIQWKDSTDLFDYPDSTVFVKNFYMVMGLAPTDTVIWETRLLLHKKTTELNTQNWWGYSYRWNAAQNEATLVNLGVGFDTAFSYVDFTGKSTYKKWKFPSQGACNECHIGRTGGPYPTETSPPGIGRGILGFIPMQLKRPEGTTDQVLRLFNQGVFTGTRPNATALSNRFIGIKEPILPNEDRKAKIDKMARSYLAVNCSGCHGDRGGSIVSAGARVPPNFDFHDLKHHDLPFEEVGSGSLVDTTSHTDSTSPPSGYSKLKWLVQASGLSSYPYWNMAIPPGDPFERQTTVIYKDTTGKGYPAFSNGLFRQMSRKMPAVDSATWYRDLINASMGGDAKATNMLTWIFSAPWGSKQWLDVLKTKNFTLDSIMAGYYNDYLLYGKDADQMPPLATYLPDTSAMKVLAEWVHDGQPPNAIRSTRGKNQTAFRTPIIQNRILVLPEGWAGKVQLLDVRGRATALQSAGANRYALPANLKPGLLIFKVGNKHFKAYLF